MARQLARRELDGVEGAVVAIDVIRAFTTAAYAFGSEVSEILLVGTVDEGVLTAELIEPARTARPFDAQAAAAALLATDEAAKTLALGPAHTDPSDIELAAAVDAFDFAMEVERTDRGLRLMAMRPS